MDIKIVKIDGSNLKDYISIPMSFEINSFLDISFQKNGLEGIKIQEKKIIKPYTKNYDDYESPLNWSSKFHLENCGIFIAIQNNFEIVGGLTIVYDIETNGILEGRNDLTVLWDIRVKNEYRGMGIGSLLFQKAIDFSKEKNCTIMKIETQNNNVPACKFYSHQGCYLGGIHKNAYKEFPNEIQLFWYKKIE